MESSAGCLAPELQRPVVIVGASESQRVETPRRGVEPRDRAWLWGRRGGIIDDDRAGAGGGSIPEQFILVLPADGLHMPCHVTWRKEKRIGVAFD
jgi:hypothetical protein